MKIKRYMAPDMRQGLRQIREELGADAVIVSTRKLREGIELIAAVDYDATLLDASGDSSLGGSTRASLQSGSKDVEEQVDSDSVAPTAQESAWRGSAAAIPEQSAVEEVQVPRPAPISGDAARGGPPPMGAAGMMDEIQALRKLLECQLSSLAWNDLSRHSPVRAALLRELIGLGLAPDLAQQFAGNVPVTGNNVAFARRWALQTLAGRLVIPESDPLAAGGVVALVGATGVGKTTTIAKLAARYAGRTGTANVVLIAADDYRIGAQEQLFSYGRMLNLPVYVANSPRELHERIRQMEHADLILIDTAGVGPRDSSLYRALEALTGDNRSISPYLVLPANAERCVLEETASAFGRLPLAGCIVTKLDEAARLGGLLSVLIRSGLPVAFSADGQQVPESLRRASAAKLVSRAVGLMEDTSDLPDDEMMAQRVAEINYAVG